MLHKRALPPDNKYKSVPLEKASHDVPYDTQRGHFWLHPLFGYLSSPLLVALGIAVLKLEFFFLPSFHFPGAPFFFIILLVAFVWGLGPALLTVALCGLALDFFYLPATFIFRLDIITVKSFAQMLPFVVVGSLISMIIVQRETVHKRVAVAEHEQHKRASELGAILEAIVDAVVVYDKAGQILDANSFGWKMVQQAGHRNPYEEDLQQRVANVQMTDGDGRPLSQEQWPQLRIIRGETFASADIVDIRIRLGDGRVLYANVSGSPLRDHEGNIIGAVCIYRDVTERRQLERQAQELTSEALTRASELEATFEAITDGVLIFNEQGNIRRANKAARQLFSLSDTLPLDERAAILAICDEQGVPLPLDQLPISRVLRGEVLTGTEAADVQAMGAQGQRLQVSVTGAPIYSADGSLAGAIIVWRDVTKRRELEQRTQHALGALLIMAETLVQRDSAHEESQFSSVNATQETVTRLVKMAYKTLGCMHISITQVDDAGMLQPSVFFGFSAEQERRAQRISQNIKANNAGEPLQHLQRNEVFVLDTTTPPFNVWAEVDVCRPLLVPIALNEQLLGVLSLDFGDTDHDYSADEIALVQAMGRLIALVIERDRLERQRTEAHANEVSLREANRRMDDFLGIASHELRTPLTAMKGYIQVADIKLTRFMAQPPCVCDEPVGAFDSLQLLFQKADAQAELINRLVNDLVDVSRIHTNKLRLNLATCDLAEVVRNAVQEQRQMAMSRTISLQLLGEAIPVFADADRIGQVVTNYLTNALKYSAPTAVVAVSLSQVGNAARVEVSDSGPGLSPEQIGHLWERFYQVPGIAVQSGSSVGLGIGLYICDTIIRSHGGAVGVQSTPGQGSTFWFTLPLCEEAE